MMPYLTSFCFVEFRLLYQSLSFVIFSFTRQHLLCAMKEKQIITMFLPHSFLNIKNKPCPMCEFEQDFAEISVSEYTYLYIHYILIFALCYMVFFTKNRIGFFIKGKSIKKVIMVLRNRYEFSVYDIIYAGNV